MTAAEGCVVMASLAAAPVTSARNPQPVELVVTACMTDVPKVTRLPLASGVPAVGRTPILVHVSEQVTPPLLAEVTVKVRFVGVMVVMGTEVPLATPLIFWEIVPLPPTVVMITDGRGAFVLKTNPAGAFKMMVPTPTLPF